MDTELDKISYSIGVDIGNNFKKQGIQINADVLTQGLQDAYKGNEIAIDAKERQEILTAFQTKIQTEQQEKTKIIAEKNLKEGRDFLVKTQARKEVKSISGGLLYEVIKQGADSGQSPSITDEVTVHYKGTFIDGKEFDSSYSRGEPTTFGVNKVIQGWTRALMQMKPGDKWKLYIPSHLAYGAADHGSIPPNSVLVFEVELLAVNLKKKLNVEKMGV